MNRSLRWSVLMALALGCSQGIAMDLGQIRVRSALGQPLLAEIPLRVDNPAELQQLRVRLASSEEFARAGIAGGRTDIPLRFTLGDAADGKVIRVTSTEAVNDPFLDLLLEVRAGNEPSMREFTILLDPPGVPAAAPTAAAPARQPAKPAKPAARPAAAPVSAPAAAKDGSYGPVERGQTLSGIARSVASSDVNMQQMMLALQKVNPDAFFRDNINALKSGVVLRVPTAEEARAMTVAAAVAEVRRQNSDWRAGTPGQPAVVADGATRTPTTADAAGQADAGDRLALVPAKSGGQQGAGSRSAAAGSGQDLLRAQEGLASLQQQSSELKARLKDLEEINSKNERLLSLKDNEIAELQAKLAEARKAAGMPANTAADGGTAGKANSHLETATATAGTAANAVSTPVAAASSVAPATSVGSADAVATVAPAATPATTKPAVAKPATKPAAKPVAKPAPATEAPWYMQTWAWAAAGGVVVLLLLLAMLGRRSKPAKKVVAAGGGSSLADRFGAEPSLASEAGTADADQDELLDQLAEHPDDIGLHLELVTLYYSRRDVDHFEAAAEAMHAHVTDSQQDEWQDVLHMGEDLAPGHPLFSSAADLPGEEVVDAGSGFDIDDYAGEAAAVTDEPQSGPKKVSEYNFNFDLTRAPDPEPRQESSAPAADEDVTVFAPVASHDADVLAGDGAFVDESLVDENPVVEEPLSTWQFDEPEADVAAEGGESAGFSDDPVDTKLDLARAYLDMGDADGARAMLDEVIKEGSQMQQDVARGLLANLH